MSQQNLLLRAAGLYSFPNRLSSIPQGALLTAQNIVINRDNIAESRRGYKIYGSAMGSGSTTNAHQLLTYKGRIFRHWGTSSGTTLDYDSDAAGTFTPFTLAFTANTHSNTTVDNFTSTSQLSSGMTVSGSGIPANTTISSITNNNSIVISNSASTSLVGTTLTFGYVISEVSSGTRLKSIEANSNLYFTTSGGMKKISVANASALSTAVITNSGGIKALDLKATLNKQTGFFNQENVIAYRIVWGINDSNNNLILGSPSSRTIIYNPLTDLLISDFNSLLSNLDKENVATGIHAQTYVTNYKVAANSSASTLRTNLINLTTGIDTDIPVFTSSGSPTVSGSGPYTVQWTVTNNPTNVISIGDPVLITGVTPTTFNTSGTVTAISASTISYSQTSNPGAYSSGTATIKRTKYGSISQPIALSVSPTTDQLVSLQNYYTSIVNTLQSEPSGINTAADFNTNNATTSATVNLKFGIPRGVTTSYFYQVYRTAQLASSTGVALSSLDPGDEEQLVSEANPTNTDLNNGYIKLQDITPDAFRGANLYTNPNTGDGIGQANDIPPISYDVTNYKNYTFYSNTITKYRKNVNLLSVSNLSSGVSTLTVTDGVTTNTYTFVSGVAEVQTVTTVADVGGNLAGKYFTLWSGNNSTQYYIWYKVSGAGSDPVISNATGIEIDISTNDSANTVATKTRSKLNQNSDFTITGATNNIIITNNTKGIATAAANGALSPGFSYSVGVTGAGEDATNKKILISNLSTPSQQVNETARSIVSVINQNASDLVYAFYLSGPTDIPGMILFEARNLGQNPFYFNVDSAVTTGTQFDPSLPISGNTVIASNEVSTNRLYYSKVQQPEAVPIVNTIDVGPKDKKILRILALRDSLFILKEEGIYRLSGLVAPFTTALFDSSTLLKATDSAVVLNNLIYMFSSQGIATVSDTGVSIISRPIEDQLIKLYSSTFTNFATATFGVSYESDRSYNLFTVTNTSDTNATQGFRYNTFTNTWTAPALIKRCGVVNSFDDLLYLGPTDTNFIEQERKNFDRTDFADREVSVTLGSSSVNNTIVTLPSLTNVNIGDVVTQVQSLTISQFNQLLSKLDMDTLLTDKNYTTLLKANAGDNLSIDLDNLITKISNDSGRLAIGGHTAAGTYTALEPTATDFSSQQTNFNNLINLLNNDVGVGYKNYLTSSGTSTYEFNILAIDKTKVTVTAPYAYPLIQGPLTVYNHITTILQYVPQYFQDASMQKHVSESTFIFEDSSFTNAVASFASDLSANFEDIPMTGNGTGIFGNFVYGNITCGGNGSGVPFRTYIPKEKQRCRYLNAKFTHSIARELFSLYGLSLTYFPVSQRGWR